MVHVLAANTGATVFGIILGVAIYIFFAIGWYAIFKKAGQPGWAAFVPIYNLLIILKIIGREWWWIFLLLIPSVSFIIWIVMMYDMSKSFGHGIGITIGLILLPFIFSLGGGFGRFEYRGPAAGPNAVAAT